MNPNGNRNKLTCTNCWEMRTHKQVFQETGKKRENMRKHYRSKKSFGYEIYARTSKATHRVFQLRVHLLLGSFSFFITCSSLQGNYGWRLGASSIRDASSNRRITVHFWIALINTFRMIYNLFGFAEVPIFPLFWVMMSLWCHFLSHGFQICIFCGTVNELSFNSVGCLWQVL